MSTIEQPLTSTTWRVDAVHSTVGFAVKHMIVSTFRGRFETYDATLVELDGDLAIHGWVDVSQHRGQGPRSGRPPAVAGVLRRRPAPADALQLAWTSRSPPTAASSSRRADDQGPHAARCAPPASITPALEDPFGGVRRGLELEAVIDRRVYGLEWNLPLPKGGLALDNDVKLIVNLEFTQA